MIDLAMYNNTIKSLRSRSSFQILPGVPSPSTRNTHSLSRPSQRTLSTRQTVGAPGLLMTNNPTVHTLRLKLKAKQNPTMPLTHNPREYG